MEAEEGERSQFCGAQTVLVDDLSRKALELRDRLLREPAEAHLVQHINKTFPYVSNLSLLWGAYSHSRGSF